MSTPEPAPEANAPAAAQPSTLRREMLAILVLYLTQCALPILIGLAFGPGSP